MASWVKLSGPQAARREASIRASDQTDEKLLLAPVPSAAREAISFHLSGNTARVYTKTDVYVKRYSFRTAISQGGLDFRLAQAIDFLAGRESCLLIASVSFSKSKRGLQADRQ
jgi:hypothetical protein